MEKICPVCATRENSSLISGVSCFKCGFEYAYVNCFGSGKSLALWKEKIEEKKKKIIADKAEFFSKRDCFVLSGDTVAYVSVDDRRLLIFRNDSFFEEKHNVRQYSKNERNSAILYEDGKIEVHGDNIHFQCNIQVSDSIISVLCGSNCIYAVGESGQVFIAGDVIDEKIRTWKNISNLACGSFHLLGLTKDKKVKIAGQQIEKNVIEKVSGWKNVKSICAATDCSIALFEDGTVSFAGREGDKRSGVEKWKNIASVKADSAYAIGLTKEGDIKLAGSCRACLDMDRTKSADWKNVIAITCSKSGIASIFTDGTLKIVGNFNGDIEKICREWAERINI